MKRAMTILAVVALSLPVLAGSIKVYDVWSRDNLLVDTTNTSREMDLREYAPDDTVFSLQVETTNAVTTQDCGIVTFQWQVSNDNTTWLNASNFVVAISHTNSMDSAGHGIYEFTPKRARYLRFRALVSQTNAYVSGLVVIR